MLRARFLLVILLLVVALVQPLAAQPFAKIDLEPRLAPEGWENARRDEIMYLDQAGEEMGESELPFYVKKQELDLILAGVVRQILAREYETQGYKIAVHQVASSTPEEILNLAAGGSADGSGKWNPETLINLARYMQNDPDHLFLFKMTAQVETGEGTSEEVLPLLLRMKQCPGQRDLVSFFFVTNRKMPLAQP